MIPRISLKNAAFSYGEKDIFRNLSFKIGSGEVLCILGANGCGKTTLLSCLNNTLKLKTGQLNHNGTDINTMSPVEIARKVGFVFQEHSAPFPFSVTEVVRMGRAPHLGFFSSPSKRDTEITMEALEMVGMAHLKDKPYTQISGGERQLVLIARTLAQKPDVIVMDEPTSHLDFKNQTLVLQMVSKMVDNGLSVIMSTHLPNHALLLSGKVALMRNGGFYAVGAPSEVISEDNLKATYDVDVKIFSFTDAENNRIVKYCLPVI